MKKLSVGVLVGILAFATVDVARADIASTGYVNSSLGSFSAGYTAKVSGVNTNAGNVNPNIQALDTAVGALKTAVGNSSMTDKVDKNATADDANKTWVLNGSGNGAWAKIGPSNMSGEIPSACTAEGDAHRDCTYVMGAGGVGVWQVIRTAADVQ